MLTEITKRNNENTNNSVQAYTRIIISKNGRYLFCVDEHTKKPVWNASPYDAWWTNSFQDSQVVGCALDAVAMLFNPLTGKVDVI